MPRLEYRLVDVFASQPFRGNPLAVFPNADGVDDATMQHIANELNLSETTFVSRTRRAGCDMRLRIFTPRMEIPMAGHPTIGSAFVVAEGSSIVFEENIGPVAVSRGVLTAGGEGWWMTQAVQTPAAAVDTRDAVAQALGLDIGDIPEGLPIEVGSAGTPGLFVPVSGLEALGRASLPENRWRSLVSSRHAHFAYVFAAAGPGLVRARCFAPAFGIAEDPATGGACGPLGEYLVRHGLAHRTAELDEELVVSCYQGIEMGRPSVIEIRPGAGATVLVGGPCVLVGGGFIEA